MIGDSPFQALELYNSYVTSAIKAMKLELNEVDVFSLNSFKEFSRFLTKNSYLVDSLGTDFAHPFRDDFHDNRRTRLMGISIYRIKDTNITYSVASIPIGLEMDCTFYYIFKKGDYCRAMLMHRRKKRSEQRKNCKIYLEDGIKKIIEDNTVEFFKNANNYVKYGAGVRRGILLYGPPGNGKSLISKWVSVMCNKHCEWYNSQDVQSAISTGKFKPSPLMIFDDIDLALMNRSSGNSSIACSFLSLLDDKTYDKPYVLIFTTNEDIKDIEDAFIRPGRIDLPIKIDKPSAEVRKNFISTMWHEDVLADIATYGMDKFIKETADFSFADLDGIRNFMVINKVNSNDFDIPYAFKLLKNKDVNIKETKKVGF